MLRPCAQRTFQNLCALRWHSLHFVRPPIAAPPKSPTVKLQCEVAWCEFTGGAPTERSRPTPEFAVRGEPPQFEDRQLSMLGWPEMSRLCRC
eukprot:6205917-Pleurochrysis_carterae.AAC.1